ncbi:SIR2 family protein [Herminiimonas arsenitoxidans]|uniref:SIR2 family protein n=1 Tax=Herminiimonas arsenitoxidans TaxID=1809410 RepID=UPI0009708CD6|nr:SIR2 family protein [Herminiimonas arsenitoxidans]
MEQRIAISDVYDKDLNFLLGAGASYGLFPTLALNVKAADSTPQTIETLATHYDQSKDEMRLTLLFMHYYVTCIQPVISFSLTATVADENKRKVVENYADFIKTVIEILQHRKPMDKRCNVFTTNYDGCLAHVADSVLQAETDDFVLNDGTRGFGRRILQAKNFNSFLCQTGVFERSHHGIPQINLIHLHGSVYWKKNDASIQVDYSPTVNAEIISLDTLAKLRPFSERLMDINSNVDDLPEGDLTPEEIENFWLEYKKLPIVNPTKWKFHETVFEEHYYQMLRLLSYELEKTNAVLITFGFSFADEHILNLVRRSLSNRSLKVYICCFNALELVNMKKYFGIYKNVEYMSLENGNLDFSAFNRLIFNVNPVDEEPAPAENVEEAGQ